MTVSPLENGDVSDGVEFGLEHGIDPDVFAKRWWTLGVLCLSLLIIMIGNTALNVAIPILSEKLQSTNSQLQWMVDAYSLVFAGLLFTAGNFGDRYGRKGILQAGLLLFGLSTAYAGFFADTSASLIGSRLVMGAGAAMVMPATLSIITNIFPTHERAKAVALWAGISGAGSALGPLLTGFVLEHFDWNAVFLVNMPFIALALVLGLKLVPRSKGEGGTPLDIPGAILSGVGLSVVIYALIEAPTHGWLSPTTLGIAAFGLASIAGFVFHELRTEHPMLDVRLFGIRSFGTSSLILTMVFFALMGTFFSLTQLLQLAWGYSALEAAVRLLPISVAMMIAAPQSANMAERFGKSRVVGAGMGLVALGILMISRVGVNPDYLLLVSGASIMAFGMGLAMSPTTDLLMSSVPRKNAGMGSAMNDTTRELGGSLGVAIFGSLLASKYVHGLSDVLPSLPAKAQEYVSGSLAGAMRVAQADPVHGKVILESATQAWLDGLRLSLLIASIIVAIAGVLAWRLLPNQAADVQALGLAHTADQDDTADQNDSADQDELETLGDPSLA
ncbi:MAG: DHA2 family efflux MFS transporter permease subunit [Microthrixaceae bacterium]